MERVLALDNVVQVSTYADGIFDDGFTSFQPAPPHFTSACESKSLPSAFADSLGSDRVLPVLA